MTYTISINLGHTSSLRVGVSACVCAYICAYRCIHVYGCRLIMCRDMCMCVCIETESYLRGINHSSLLVKKKYKNGSATLVEAFFLCSKG